MQNAVCALSVLFLIICGLCRSAEAVPAWIQVRDTMIRAKPAFYSPGVIPLRYGDRVEKISEERGWIKVRSSKGEGFLPASSLSSDTIILSARDVTKVEADSTEVILAGKGFSREVEQEYRKQATGVRFDLVDRVERSARVTSTDVREFIKQGELTE